MVDLHRYIFLSTLLITLITMVGCEKETPIDSTLNNEPDLILSKDSVRILPTSYIENPAIWDETNEKATIKKITPFGEGDVYYALISGNKPGMINRLGVSEYNSVRRNWGSNYNLSMWVNEMIVYQDYLRHPEQLLLGAIDYEKEYYDELDIDSAAIYGLHGYFTKSDHFINNKSTLFTSAAKDDRLAFWIYDDRFILSGNSFDSNSTSHPFLASLLIDDSHYTGNVHRDSITVVQPMDDKVGVEFKNVRYDFREGILHVIGYDQTTDEYLMICYSLNDNNDNGIYDYGDNFNELWETRFDDLTMTSFSGRFIVGTVTTELGDTAGKIISLDYETGQILWSKILDLTDQNDGFLGTTKSGPNYFAYGYSNRIDNGQTINQSNGWIVKFMEDGTLVRNRIYTEEDAIIEITSACSGFDRNNIWEYGSVLVGGNKLNSSNMYEVFVTEFSHNFYE